MILGWFNLKEVRTTTTDQDLVPRVSRDRKDIWPFSLSPYDFLTKMQQGRRSEKSEKMVFKSG